MISGSKVETAGYQCKIGPCGMCGGRVILGDAVWWFDGRVCKCSVYYCCYNYLEPCPRKGDF